MTSYYDFSITLFRDSLSTPWGFRLEGGRDYQTPLTIQRVFTGSPASGDLQRGDVITSIQHRDASFLLHQEANDLIRNSGGSIQLGIRRSGNAYSYAAAPDARPTSATPYRSGYSSQNPISSNLRPNNLNAFQAPAHLYNAEDPLSSYIRSRPIEKSRDPKPILSQTGSPMMPGEMPSVNSAPSVKRYRPLLAKLPTTNFSGAGYQPAYQTSNTTPTPFNEKAMINQLHHTLSRVTSKPPQSIVASNSYGSHSPTRSMQQNNHNYSAYSASTINLSQPETSPWQTSLRRTAVDPFESQYQQASPSSPSYHVSAAPKPVNKVFSQHEVSDVGAQKSPLPRAINLQYNSPIGLYSNANIQEEFYKKVGAHYQASSEF